MRYYLIFLIPIISLFTKCTNPTKTDSIIDSLTNADSVATVDTNKHTLENYESALAKLPMQSASSLEGLKLFETTFDVDNPEENDVSLKTYLAFQSNLIGYLNSHLEDNPTLYQNLSTLIGDSTKYSPIAVQYLNTLHAQGLTIGQSEGTIYYESSPQIIQTYFLQTLTPGSKEYLKQYTKELNQPFSEDAGLLISLQELADRLAFWDNFINNYPSNPFIQKANDKYKEYLRTFLLGQDNTPAFYYDTNIFNAEFVKSYRYFVATYPTSKSASKIKDYMNILEKNNFQKNNEVELFQNKLMDY